MLVSSSGGLVLFGICSVIMDIFKIVYYAGHMHCESPVKIAFPAVQAVFVIVQVGLNCEGHAFLGFCSCVYRSFFKYTLVHIPDIHPLGPRKRLCTDTANHHTVSPGVQDNVMQM